MNYRKNVKVFPNMAIPPMDIVVTTPRHTEYHFTNCFAMQAENKDGVAGVAIASADERVNGALAFFPVDEYTNVVCTPHK